MEWMEQRILLAARLGAGLDGSFSAAADSSEFPTEQVFWHDRHVEARQGEWLVQFRQGVSDAPSVMHAEPSSSATSFDDSHPRDGLGYARNWLRRLQPERLLTVTGTSEQWIYRFEDTLITSAMLHSFSMLPDVVSVEPNQVHSVDVIPNDPAFSQLSGLNTISDHDIDAPEAWDLSTGSSGMVVGVVDTGVFYDHEDLSQNIWVNPVECPGGYGTCQEDGIDDDMNGYVDDFYGWDFYNNDNDPFDDNGHGTHVAGTIAAAGNNGVGVVGVNWNTKIMALKFLSASGRGTTSGAVQAIQYATMMKRDHGVDIRLTNNSWGGGGYSQSLYDAIEESRSQDMLFVAAAGNDSENNDVQPHYPASYDHDNVISVAATTTSGALSSFSNTGLTTVDLGAPGSHIYSTLPDHQYGYKSGTSMASPHVAGIAALAWSTDASATYDQVRDAVLGGAVPLAALDGTTVTGGLANARAAIERMGMFATPTSPAEHEIVGVAPTSFTIDFSAPINAASLNASDLLVNSIVADNVTLVDSDTAEFSFNTSPVTVEGTQVISMAAGSVTQDSDGSPIAGLAVEFFYDPTPLRVDAVFPAGGSTLLLPDPTIQIDFSEPILPSSLSHRDLVLSDGRVKSYNVIDADSVSYTLTGISSESELTVALPAGSVADTDGFPNQPFSTTFILDRDTSSLAVRWDTVAPLGARARRTTVSGIWHQGADTDAYEVGFESGQLLSLILSPQAGDSGTPASGRIVILDPTGTEIVRQDTPVGAPLVASSIPITLTGTYQLIVESVAGAPSSYSLDLLLNSAVEQASDPPGNGTLANSENLDGSWTLASASISQASVLASLSAGGDVDWYSATVSQAVPMSVVVATPIAENVAVSLHAADGSVIATGSASGESVRIDDWVPGVTQTVYVQVTGDDGDYVLSLIRGGSLDLDSPAQDRNGSIASAADLYQTLRAVGHLGTGTSGGPGIGGQSATSQIESLFASAEIRNVDGGIDAQWEQAIDPRDLVGARGAVHEFVSIGSDPEGDQIKDLVYTPDGTRYLIAHPESGNVLVYDAASGNVLADIPISGKPVDLEVTPNGDYVLSANSDGNTVSVISLASLTKVAEIATSGAWPYRIHATPDSSEAVVATADNQFVVISLTAFEQTRMFDATGLGSVRASGSFGVSGRYSIQYTDFVISGDGTKLVNPGSDSSGSSVDIYDLASGNLLASIPVAHRQPSLTSSADGNTVYATSRDSVSASTISKIDLATNGLVSVVNGPGLYDDHTLLTPDEQFLMAGGFNSLTFIDLADGSVSSDVNLGSTESFALSHDGQYVLARHVVSVASQSRVATLPVFPWLDTVVASPTQMQGIQASSWVGEEYSLIDLDGSSSAVAANRIAGAEAEGDAPVELAVTADGLTAITANYDSRNLSIVDLQNRVVTGWIDVAAQIDSMAVTPDGSYAVTASSSDPSYPVSFVDLENGVVDVTLTGFDSRPRHVAISNDGSKAYVVTTGANDQTDKIYFVNVAGASTSISQSVQVGNTANGSTEFTRITLSPDGSLLAVPITRDAEVAIFDTATESEVARVSSGGTFPTEAVFTPDGQTLFVRNAQGDSISAIQIDGAQTSLQAVIGGVESPRDLVMDDAGEYLYVTGGGSSGARLVYVIDVQSLDLVQSVELGTTHVPTALHLQDGLLYTVTTGNFSTQIPFADYQDTLVRVSADGANTQFIDATPLGGRSRLVSYSAAIQSAVVALYDDDGLELVDLTDTPSGDEDFYRFLPQVGDNVVLSTTQPGSIASGSDPDAAINDLELGIQVFGPDQVLIASSAEGTIQFTATAIGNHYVRVYAQGFTSGEYTLAIDGVLDLPGPALIDFSPIDEATDVALNAALEMTFDETVLLGSGQIVIKRVADDSTFAAIDITSSEVVINGNSVTVTPATPWELGTDYYVLVDSGTLVNLTGGDFAGITDPALWNFQVGYGFDFGDAPLPYPVSQADAGARHSLFEPHLGELRDSEPDGVVSIAADADDTAGSDDEDGVVFAGLQVGQTDATLTLDVRGVSTTAFIDAWLDFDADGNWGGTQEQIAASVAVSEGMNLIEFDVPGWAVTGQTYARVRLSSAGNLGPKGNAPNGEVEDHLVTIAAPAAASKFFTDRKTLVPPSGGSTDLFPVDLDSDGDMDLLFTRTQNTRLGWLENDGNGSFTAHQLYNDFLTDAFAASDIDADGDIDVVAVSAYSDQLRWYRNDGNQNFEKIVIDDQLPEPRELALVDFDSDGDLDVVINDKTDDLIRLYSNDGAEVFSGQTLITEVDTDTIAVVDFDRDGDLDILTDDDGTSWFENTAGGFTQHSLATMNSYSVHVVDIDSDGDLDVLSGESFGIKLFLNDGSQSFSSVDVDNDTFSYDIQTGDLDGDGDLDVIANATQNGRSFAWFDNAGDETFTRRTLTNETTHMYGIAILDTDGDADLDIVSSTYGSGIFEFENINGVPPLVTRLSPTPETAMASPTTNLVVTFDQEVVAGAGSLSIHRFDDDTLIETLSSSSTQVSIVGNTMTVDPTAPLANDTTYYVLIDPAAVQTAAGDAYPGLVLDDWFFTTVATGVDYGDAPDVAAGNAAGDYNSTLTDNGASHVLTAGLYLGHFADVDDGTLQNAAATADDADGLRDDEDGLANAISGQVFTVGAEPRLTFVATNLTDTPATLGGWIDYNDNGIFEAAESASATVPPGLERALLTLTFPTVPAATLRQVVMRVRLGHDVDSIGPVGASAGGEVEDHLVSIRNPGIGVAAASTKIENGSNGAPALNADDRFGAAVAPLGDLDGDGVDDVAIGAPFDDQFMNNAGAVYVAFLNTDGSIKSHQKILPNSPGLFYNDRDYFGSALAPVGDLDHDGVVDLAVLARSVGGASGNAALNYLFLNADGTLKDITHTRLTIDGRYPSLEAMASIGDLNGDGLGDFAFSGQGLRVDNRWPGAVYIMFGDTDGFAKEFKLISNGVGGGPVMPTDDYFGSSVTAIGDIDGDGVTDLAVGADGDDSVDSTSGAVYILLMNRDGTAKSTHKINGLGANEPTLGRLSRFGSSVASIGDLNGDGRNELLVGSEGQQVGSNFYVGQSYVLYLNADGSVQAYTTLGHNLGGVSNLDNREYFGSSASPAGDINGDGIVDLLIGSEINGIGGSGAVHVLTMDAGAPPTEINLSPDGFEENLDTSGGDLEIGTLAATDPTAGDSHSFSLVAGPGDQDNDKFLISGASLWLRQGKTIDHESQAELSIRVQAIDSTGLSFAESIVIEVYDLPEIENVEVNDGDQSRSKLDAISIRFDGLISHQSLANAIRVTNRNTNTDVVSPLIFADDATGKTVVQIDFLTGTINDGNYELAVDGALIQFYDGRTMATDYRFGDNAADSFFRLLGDVDGDRDVDVQDYGRFGKTFLQSLGDADFDWRFDADDDGDVDGLDLGLFRRNFLRHLPGPS